MTNFYYTPPSDEAFEDMKQGALAIWRGYRDPRYIKEKVERIEHVKNIADNFMYILAMFDHGNQRRLGELLKEETKDAARARLIAGGATAWEMPF